MKIIQYFPAILISFIILPCVVYAQIEAVPVQTSDEIVKELEWGKAVFRTQNSLGFKEVGTVEFVLSHLVPIKNLIRQLQQDIEKEHPGSVVTNRIEARLSGDGFGIEAIEPEIQAFSSEGLAKWKWNIVAIDAGLQNLNLTLSVIMIIAHRDAPFVIWDYDQSVNVEITKLQLVANFFSNPYLWLSVAMLLVGGLYITSRYRKRKTKS